MTIASPIARPIARPIASPLDGSGGGGGTVYGPEMLANVEFDGAVAGSPGTQPTSWLNLRVTGSLAEPLLTFDVSTTRRAIYQTFAAEAGTYKMELEVTVNSGVAACVDVLWYAVPGGGTVQYLLDGVEVLGSAALSGTHVVSTICVIPAGTLEFRCGAGCAGDRTQNVTITNPTMKKAV